MVAEQDSGHSQEVQDLRARAQALLRDCSTMTLATAGPEGLWAAAVFFAPHGLAELFFISSPTSRHSRNLLAAPSVAATVHPDVGDDWRSIRGLQLEGQAAAVEDSALARAQRTYFAKFPFAESLLKPSGGVYEKTAGTVWFVLRVRHLFLVDNRLGFGVRREIDLGARP